MQQEMMKPPIQQQPKAQAGGVPMQQPQQQPSPIRAEDLQKVLLQRVAQLSPEEEDILDSMITPETNIVLMKLFPELGIIFEVGSSLRGAEEDRDSNYGSDIVPAQGVSKGLVR